MRSYPGPNRRFGNVDVETLADHALRVAYRVAQVVRGNRFQDHARRIGLVFSSGCVQLILERHEG
jgi:hypothetical protein